NIAYYAPERSERSGEPVPIATPRTGEVKAFSWSLKDVIDLGIFELLFSDESRSSENLVTLINFFAHKLPIPRSKARSLYQRLGVQEPSVDVDARRQLTETNEYAFDGKNELGVSTFEGLLQYVQDKATPNEEDFSEATLQNMSRSTIQALWRRLL